MKANIFQVSYVFIVLGAAPASAEILSICTGANRAEHKLTCVVDGDTGWEKGVKWRLLAVDAPEISHAACHNEFVLARAARDRLLSLMSGGYKIIKSRTKDQNGRALVHVELADGRDAGEVLMREGLAQPWPNTGNIWCGR